MLLTRYKFWPSDNNKNITNSSLLLLSLQALKFNAKSFMEIDISNYTNEQKENLHQILLIKEPTIRSYAMNEPERFWHFMHHLFPMHPDLLTAFDIMGWDIWAQLYKNSFQDLIKLPRRDKNTFEYWKSMDEHEGVGTLAIPLNKALDFKKEIENHSTIIITCKNEDELKSLENLEFKKVEEIWLYPSFKLKEFPAACKGLILDPFVEEGFTPLINSLMKWRKQNVPVGMLMNKGSVISQTVYAQFSPILQKLYFPFKKFDLPMTGIEIEENKISFPQAAGMGLASVEGFW